MSAFPVLLLIFSIALILGIVIGKLLFSARFQLDKISLEEKLIASNSQINQQKELLISDKINFEKQLQITILEK